LANNRGRRCVGRVKVWGQCDGGGAEPSPGEGEHRTSGSSSREAAIFGLSSLYICRGAVLVLKEGEM